MTDRRAIREGLSGSRPSLLAKLALFLFVGLLVVPIAPAAETARAAAPSIYYVEPSGHSLGEPFLTYWVENDGQQTLGNPITEIVEWGSKSAQYFEYGVLLERRDESVTRLKTARELLELRHEPDALLGNDRRAGSEPRTAGYLSPVVSLVMQDKAAEPAYAVANDIQTFYAAHGAKAFFGKPLSNAVKSADRTVQWFEYGRVEIVDGEPSLAAVGTELAFALGQDMSAVGRGDAPIFDPNRYQKFFGDGTIPNAAGTFIPTRITIPKIRINATIESVGVTRGVMDTPKDVWSVGWYPSMSSPGEWTNVVMAGHRDWWNVGPVVFWNLHLLAPGDKIYVAGPDGSGATYVVMTGWLIDADEPADDLIADTGFEALTLITCGGKWDGKEYSSRYVIRAKRI